MTTTKIIIAGEIANIIGRKLYDGAWTAEQAGERTYQDAHAHEADLSDATAAWCARAFRCDSAGFVAGWRSARERDRLQLARLGFGQLAFVPLADITF